MTCGLIIRSPSGWLLAHGTGLSWWDIPKGKQEQGEEPLAAALRECQEETGLDLSSYRFRFQDLGARPYCLRRNKVLHLFVLDLQAPLSLSECLSTHQVRRGGHLVQEMDDFAWVSVDRVHRYVRRRMARHLVERGLLPYSSHLPK